MESKPATDGAVTAPGPMSIFEVLFSPGGVFRRLAAHPRWLPALLVLMAVTTGLGVTMAARLDWEGLYRTEFAKNARMDQMPADKREEMVQMSAKVGSIGAAVAPVVATPIIYLLVTTLFWVLLKVGGGSDWKFKQAFAASLHGFAPAIPGTAVAIAILLASDPSTLDPQNMVASSVAALVEKEAVGPFVHAVLQSIELFSIWSMVMLVIGYSVTARVSKGKAAGFVVGTWLVYVLLKSAVVAAFSGMMSS